MNFLKKLSALAVLAATTCLAPANLRAEGTNTAPDFKEVYDLVKTHLAGTTEADLDKAAVFGLIQQLHTRISLEGKGAGASVELESPLLARASMFENGIGYLRFSRIAGNVAEKVSSAIKDLGATNRLKGLILDLRFADGRDYAAAVAVADLFLSKEAPMLDWGNGVVKSKAKTDAITLPITVLVNQKTVAAPEAVAGILRQADRGVVIGTNTAGEATMDQMFPLKNGQSLRIATSTVRLGSGDAMSANGLVPDVVVSVSSEDEKAYYADPYKDLSRPSALLTSLGAPQSNGTNRTRLRPTEADLIKERKANPGREVGYSVDPSREGQAEKPVVRDPALARALDLLKVISVLQAGKPA